MGIPQCLRETPLAAAEEKGAVKENPRETFAQGAGTTNENEICMPLFLKWIGMGRCKRWLSEPTRWDRLCR